MTHYTKTSSDKSLEWGFFFSPFELENYNLILQDNQIAVIFNSEISYVHCSKLQLKLFSIDLGIPNQLATFG